MASTAAQGADAVRADADTAVPLNSTDEAAGISATNDLVDDQASRVSAPHELELEAALAGSTSLPRHVQRML
eukprot:6184293-Pleurochrysis_carterae.AAC.1